MFRLMDHAAVRVESGDPLARALRSFSFWPNKGTMKEAAQWILLGAVLGGLMAATVFNIWELLR
jgi:hypothetical protein